jgi:tRNA-2-methylthio-N6-dimethylallyladenosine synthase
LHCKNKVSLDNNLAYIGKIVHVLIDSFSKKSKEDLSGRNDQNIKVVFPKGNHQIGDYVNVLIERVTTTTLIGKTLN